MNEENEVRKHKTTKIHTSKHGRNAIGISVF